MEVIEKPQDQNSELKAKVPAGEGVLWPLAIQIQSLIAVRPQFVCLATWTLLPLGFNMINCSKYIGLTGNYLVSIPDPPPHLATSCRGWASRSGIKRNDETYDRAGSAYGMINACARHDKSVRETEKPEDSPHVVSEAFPSPLGMLVWGKVVALVEV